MDNYILLFNSSKATPQTAGGKGANLCRLTRAGFPVPIGFIIATAAYDAFLQANGLAGKILELSRSVSPDDPASLEAASLGIRQLFAIGTVPDEIARTICQFYHGLFHDPQMDGRGETLPGPAVAVRSSSTAEDLPGASFAGQQETFLNICSDDALLGAVKNCWSSLWTGRAMAYRARKEIVPTAVSLAVVVQRMVPAEAAGVLFTVNPVTGNPNEMLINASWGLGEAIVCGWVTPDTVTVDRATGLVKQAEISEKLVMTVAVGNGTAEVPVEPQRRQAPVLSVAQAAELAGLGQEIEAHFGCPQDIEWAIVDENVFILQARPVTALPKPVVSPALPEPEVPGDDDWPITTRRSRQPFDLWTQVNVGEAFPHPITPFTWSGLPEALDRSFTISLGGLKTPYLNDIQWSERFYGRVFLNEGALTHILSEEFGLPGSFIDAAFGSRRGSDGRRKLGLKPIKFLRRLPILLKMTRGQMGADKGFEKMFPQIDQWVDDFSQKEIENLSDDELLSEAMNWAERATDALNMHTTVSQSAMTSFSWLEAIAYRWTGRRGLAYDLVTGLSGVFVAEIGANLWQIAQTISDLGLGHLLQENSPEDALIRLREMPEAKKVNEMLDAFLQRHGHRCPGEAEWLAARWIDAPEQVVEILAGYQQAGDRIDPVKAEGRQRGRREEAVRFVESRLDFVRRSIFRSLMARAQHAVRLRDNGRHYVMKTALPLSRIHRLLSRRWTTRGWLGQPIDYPFLTIPEVRRIIETGDPAAAGLDLQTLVAGRRQAYEYWFTVEAPEVFGPNHDPVISTSAIETSSSYLEGIPASGGRARGVARIISSSAEAIRMQPGEILVTRATDPGWTPIFPLVGGLVLEIGGQLSHGAIVAREYGVPAVVNIREATRQIKEGQVITVDGSAGRVYFDGE